MKWRMLCLVAATLGLPAFSSSALNSTEPTTTAADAPASDTPAAPSVTDPAPTADAPPLRYAEHITPIFQKHCHECHAGPEPEAGISLQFADEAAIRTLAADNRDYWMVVAAALEGEVMPPEDASAPLSDATRRQLVDWINDDLLASDVFGQPDPGPFMLRRLNNRQYANTIRDLLYLPDDWNAAADFPADERGDGFDTNGDTLVLSAVLIEHYLRAAEKSVNEALHLNNEEIRFDDTLPSDTPLNDPVREFDVDFADRQGGVRANIEVFAPRAFRRPATEEEIDGLMEFASLAFTHDGESFDKATALAIRAALMSPDFLFRMERDPNPDGTGKVFQITEFQLASRLSYFLWSTMPDEELFEAARQGRLRANLDQQIRRMLTHPKARSLTEDFLGQWLEIRSLEDTPNCPPDLLAAMKAETEHFFDYIVREDRSIMDLLDADYTFVNETLAVHYDMPGIRGQDFRIVDVNPAERGGIFTHASVLTLTSKPLGDSRRTSPVNRGKWILENVFSRHIPPPPPDVPALGIDTGEELKGTVRQIFEQHRADPNCAACHARMDPYGFALENYDGLGAWRAKDNSLPVDASGEIDGHAFDTPRQFRGILAERRDEFRRSLVQKLLSYALGRNIQSYDRPAVDEICSAVEREGDRFSSVIVNIARCYPFQHARGSTGTAPPPEPQDERLTVEDAVRQVAPTAESQSE